MSEKKFSLADAMRDAVGSASVTNMPTIGERTLEQLAADIVRLDNQVGLGLIAIGNDLLEAKSKVEHGKWGEWLDLNCGYSERKAQMCMQVARRYAANPQLVADLGIRKVTALMMLPAGEDQSFIEAHDVQNMSTRELEDAIKLQKELEKERDEAKAAAEKAMQESEELRDKVESLTFDKETLTEDYEAIQERVKELESRPVDVAVQVDEAAVQKAADEARAAAEAEWKDKVAAANDMARNAESMAKDVADKLKATEDKLAKAKEKSKTAGEKSNGEVAALKAEADRLRAELETARREQAKASISGDADLAAFQLLFEQVQTDVNKMRGILLKVRGRENSELGGKLTAALLALADKVKECAA